MSQSQELTVTLYGKTYRITTEHDQDLVIAAAEQLDTAISDLLAQKDLSSTVQDVRVALFGALSALTEQISTSGQSVELRESLETKVGELERLCDQAL